MPYQALAKINSPIHHPLFSVLHKESPALYTAQTIKTFAQALTGLFIPIFIFTLPNVPTLTGDSIKDGLILILIFYLIRSIAALSFMNLITNTVFGFLNFKKSIFLGNIFLAISMILLALSTFSLWFLFFSAITYAIETCIYWIPYHLFFIRKASNATGQYGHTYGIRLLLSQGASAAGPIIGGFIITFAGFPTLFAIGTVLTIASAIPVLFSIHENNHGKHNARHIFERLFRSKSLRNDTIAIASVECDALLYSVFWPVLLFTVAGSYSKLGVITTISVTISCLAALIIGNLVDKNGGKVIHKIGCTINSILYLPRAFMTSLQAFFILDIVDKLNGILYAVPFNVAMYEHAKYRMHESDYIVYRVIVSHLALVFMSIIAIGLVLILADWQYIFIFMAMVCPFAYLVNKKSK
jgi:MFS family permease